MKTVPAASFAVLAALVVACAPKQAAPPRPDENAIRSALAAQFAKVAPAFAAKDSAAFAAVFTEDATWILPDASSATGRANIAAAAQRYFGTYESTTAEPTVIDKLIVVSDSEAVTFVHGTYTITVKGKRPERRVNPFADLWKKGADGVWRIAYEINADGPATPAPAAR